MRYCSAACVAAHWVAHEPVCTEAVRVRARTNAGELQHAAPVLAARLSDLRADKGDDHPDTVNVCFNLALVLKVTGSTAEAEKLFQKAHAGFEALYGPDHDDTQAAAKHITELARTKKP